jgi:hypothetical protein
MRDRDEPNMNHLSVVGWPYRWMIRGTNQSLDMTRTVTVHAAAIRGQPPRRDLRP